MSLRTHTEPRWLLSTMLIAGAALFAIGVAAERNAATHHTGSATEATKPAAAEATNPAATAAASGDADGGETTAHTETQGGDSTGHSETSGETVLGVNLESNGLVAFAVVISLALAVLTWLRSRHSVLFATLGFVFVFAVFDVAEVAHQLKESRGGLAALAGAIALVHLATAVVAEQRATTKPT